MKLFKYIALGAVALGLTAVNTACVGDLDVDPTDPKTKTSLTGDEWVGYFSGLYTCFLYAGNIKTSDDGAGCWTRCHWNLQEITADEILISQNWNDPGYMPLIQNTWLDNNEWVYAAMAHEMDLAKQAADFIAKSDGARSALGDPEVDAMVAEAHVLRAMAYYNMIDLFGRGPWIDENSVTGATPPTFDRKELFDATVAELTDAINSGNLRKAAQQVYGRVSWEAANALLAKLYLNAEVYTGTGMWSQCVNACKAAMSTGITLAPEYKYLFCGTNDRYVGNGEILWGVPQEPGVIETYAGTTYFIVASAWGNEQKAVMGTNNAWSGLRVRPELATAFEDGDKRNLLYGEGMETGVEDLLSSTEGYLLTKYRQWSEEDYDNSDKTWSEVENIVPTSVFSPVDYPLIRMADLYLMMAECQLHGVQCDGLTYYNQVRERAGLEPVAAYSANDLLHERMVELYCEGWRRSDLIRFGKYTGSSYNWSWKGGSYEGASIAEYRSLFAVPYQYVPTLGQNPGY